MTTTRRLWSATKITIRRILTLSGIKLTADERNRDGEEASVTTKLTKSRFVQALECPRKLSYSRDARYVNTRASDEFLQGLADGGFQVGELARLFARQHDPDAIDIAAADPDAQVHETAKALKSDSATVFEATIRHENLLVRVDVLEKRGEKLYVKEVKSKSFDPAKHKFLRNDGGIRAEWLPYLYDLAFQIYVVSKAFPHLDVTAGLVLLDPVEVIEVDGLSSALKVQRVGRTAEVIVSRDLDLEAVSPLILKCYDMNQEVQQLLDGVVDAPGMSLDFDEFVERISTHLVEGTRPEARPGRHCRACEFNIDPSSASDAARSGWSECLAEVLNRIVDRPREDSVFGVSHLDPTPYLERGKLYLDELDESDIPANVSDSQISRSHRQQLRVREAHEGNHAALLRRKDLQRAFAGVQFPLHFVDFETARPTLPFTRGRTAKQQLLFQFSHHLLNEDGRLAHQNQYLCAEAGVEPSLQTVEAFLAAIGEQGTVIHWWDHERTVLADLERQFRALGDAARVEAADRIRVLLGNPTDGSSRLFDLGRLFDRQVFLAGTEGRSSIKKVLPVVMARSAYLRAKYGQPVYGTPEIPSMNFERRAWWRKQGNAVIDPYDLLGGLLHDHELDAWAAQAEAAEHGDFIANGGAAMFAFSELQDDTLLETRRAELTRQLYRYCELDSLAMVMIYEALREWILEPATFQGNVE